MVKQLQSFPFHLESYQYTSDNRHDIQSESFYPFSRTSHTAYKNLPSFGVCHIHHKYIQPPSRFLLYSTTNALPHSVHLMRLRVLPFCRLIFLPTYIVFRLWHLGQFIRHPSPYNPTEFHQVGKSAIHHPRCST